MSRIKKSKPDQFRGDAIKAKIEELRLELQTLQAEQPQLQEQLQAARKAGSRARAPAGTASESSINSPAREIHGRLSLVNSRLSDLPREIAQLEAELSMLEQACNADQVIAASTAKAIEFGKQAATLQANQDQLSRRIAETQNEISSSLAIAAQAEQGAAQAIAGATCEEEKQAASLQMEKAVELSVAKESSNRIKQRAIDAMVAEAANLTKAIDELERQIQEEEIKAAEAALLKLGEQWNQKAAELSELGALIASVDMMQGGRLHMLDGLALPLLATKSRHTIDRYCLLEKAEDRSLTIHDLASV